MIKYFCDCCGRELPAPGPAGENPLNPLGRLRATVKGGDHTLSVTVITEKDGTSNSGHFCKYCVLDALAKLDDRIPNPHPQT